MLRKFLTITLAAALFGSCCSQDATAQILQRLRAARQARQARRIARPPLVRNNITRPSQPTVRPPAGLGRGNTKQFGSNGIWNVRINETDQTACQAEAEQMARRRFKNHVGRTIGRFEGCGWSSAGMPNTCTPNRRGMTLTGDGVAKGPDGYYRVRSWR